MIFYFSGTGNTRWAAEELARKIGEKLLFIPDELKGNCEYELQEDERLGFCFPVHGWQPPHIVRAFIRKATFKVLPTTFVYALVTCGDSIGRTMEILNKDLEKKHLHALSVYSLIMPVQAAKLYHAVCFMRQSYEGRWSRAPRSEPG